MVLIIAMTAFLLVTFFFVIDASKDQSTTSELSTYLSPFESETYVRHSYSAPVESVWKELSNLAGYNYWFPGVARLLPVVETDRYVHKYSFDQFDFLPGSELTVRPRGPFPSGKGMIASAVPNKKLEMVMQFNPFNKEFVSFNLESHNEGTTLTCTRKSFGPFSFLTVWGFDSKKSKILDNLGFLIPEQEIANDDLKSKSADTEDGATDSLFEDRNLIAAYLVNKTLDGDDNIIKSTKDVYARGKAKALLIKINRGTAERPPMPDPGEQSTSKSEPPSTTSESKKETVPPKVDQSPEDIIASVVNSALDGDDAPLNALDNKVLRAKAKAMMVKIKRGTMDRPAMPDTAAAPLVNDESQTESPQSTENQSESTEDLINRLVADGVDGKMDEINELTDKVLRGKIKAAIVKAKRSS